MMKRGKLMRKGDIYFATLDPTVGSEVKKTRPVLIISNDLSNQFSSLLTIIPLTSQIKKLYPGEVLLAQAETSLSKDSKAQCNQIRAISKMRIQSATPVGRVSECVMRRIHMAIQLHLDI